MSTQSAAIVQRLWNYCNVLRDDGVSYGDYVDQRLRQAVLKRAFAGRLVGQEADG
jgi:type I restriction enzyme M protein